MRLIMKPYRKYIVVAEVTVSQPTLEYEMSLLINILGQDDDKAVRTRDVIGGHINDAIQAVSFVHNSEIMMVREMNDKA